MKRRNFAKAAVLCAVPKLSLGQAISLPPPATPASPPGAPGSPASPAGIPLAPGSSEGGPLPMARPTRPAAAFTATTVPGALAALGAANPLPGNAIKLDAADIVTDRGAAALAVTSDLPGITQIAVLVERATFPLAAVLRPDGAAPPWRLQVQLDWTSRLTVLVQAEGRWYVASREIKVAAKPW